jgi:DNA-binding transcriptional MocR family regulator
MSIPALNWARSVITGSASRKAVLYCLANYANEAGEAYPSVDRIVSETELNRKTVLDAVRELAEQGILEDTGRRVGQTNGIRVWRLKLDSEAVPKVEPYQKRNSTENGSEAVPFLDRKRSQKRDTEPKGTYIDPVRDNLGCRYTRETLIERRRLKSMDSELDRPQPQRRMSETEARVARARATAEAAWAEENQRDKEAIERAFANNETSDLRRII